MGIPCYSLRHRHHGALVYVDMTLEVDDMMTAKSLVEVKIGVYFYNEIVGTKGKGLAERALSGCSRSAGELPAEGRLE